MIYSGFWRRVFASIVDSIIFVPISYLISVTQILGIASFEGFFVGLILSWLYFSICESQGWQATLGKKLLGIKVTDLHGQKISFARATGRYVSKFLSYITLGIGYLMPIFTKRKQALHDLVAETLVLRVEQGQHSSEESPVKSNPGYINTLSGEVRKIVMAGFDSTGHVLRLTFSENDVKLTTSGLIIGRDSRKADLYIPDLSISRVHARVYKHEGDLWIEDMGSTNGMIVNGKKILPGQSAFLSVSGTVSIGSIDLTLGRA